MNTLHTLTDNKQTKRGFTIVELLIVIVIIAILAALAFVAYNGITGRGNQAAAGAHLADLIKQIEVGNVYDGQYPVDLEGVQGAKDGDLFIPYDGRYCVATQQSGQYYSRFSDSSTVAEGQCQESSPGYAIAPDACFSVNASTESIDGYYTHQNDNPANALCPSEFTTPSSIGGVTIRHIGESALRFNTQVRKVALHNGLESIESYSFSDTPLEYLYLPQTLQRIGDVPFLNTNIRTLSLPPRTTDIACASLSDMPQLTSLVIGAAATANDPEFTISCPLVGYDGGLQNLIIGPRVSTIASGTFNSRSELKSLIIIDGETSLSIGASSFAYTHLTNVTLPGRTIMIGAGAFSGIDSLNKVVVKEGSAPLTIESAAFGGASLKQLSLPSNTTMLRYGALGTSGLTNFTIASGGSQPLTITDGSIAGQITSFTVPSHTTLISNIAFMATPSLSSLTIDGNGSIPLTINNGSFMNTSLQSVAFPARVVEVSQGAFKGISSLTNVTFERGIQTIGYEAFADTSIATVAIPNETTVDPTAFPASTIITRF